MIEDNKASVTQAALFKTRNRRYDGLKERYTSFAQGIGFHPYAYIMPSFADLLQHPTFQDLIQDDTKEVIGDEEWSTAISGFSKIITEYSKTVFTHANASLFETLKELQADARSGDWKYSFEVSDLVLEALSPKTPSGFYLYARGFAFFGQRCRDSECYPIDAAIERGRGSGYNPWLGSYTSQLPWDGTGIKASKTAVIVAIELLNAFGVKWDTSGMSILASLGPIFACARCPTVKTVMTWSQLVSQPLVRDCLPWAYVRRSHTLLLKPRGRSVGTKRQSR